jgi:hypothetical protein
MVANGQSDDLPEVVLMLSVRKSFQIAAIIGFIFVIYSSLVWAPELYALSNARSAGMDASGNITILEAPQAPSFGQGSVVVGDSCEQGICGDIFPKDGKIEGKPVLAMNPAGVNSRGQVVGLCILEGESGKHAFVRESDGRIWIFGRPLPAVRELRIQ